MYTNIFRDPPRLLIGIPRKASFLVINMAQQMRSKQGEVKASHLLYCPFRLKVSSFFLVDRFTLNFAKLLKFLST
jgi:hypothetical protein